MANVAPGCAADAFGEDSCASGAQRLRTPCRSATERMGDGLADATGDIAGRGAEGAEHDNACVSHVAEDTATRGAIGDTGVMARDGSDAFGGRRRGDSEREKSHMSGGKRRFRLPLSVVVICVCLVVVAVSLVVYVDSLSFTVRPTYASADSNPLMGFAAAADDKSAAENEQLVYIDLTWAQWEPEKGAFDIAALEKKNNIARWRAEGKHAVLRFVCDVPGNEAHRDIPQWLYEQTGDGADYDNEYGKGYAPDYSNATFRAAHARAIAALGAWASQDTFVSYVELGSLGHWGEWHTLEESGVPAMPEERLCREYYSQYQSAFPQARLLTRRNYALSVDSGAGVYNDMTGSSDDTLEWLAWQLAGGSQEVADYEIAYSPVEDIWRTAPVGGEFTSSLDMGYMLGDNIVQTLNLLRSSHMTFIGPHYPKGEYAESAGAHMVSGFLGYRLWVSELDVRFDALTRCWDITMKWRNDGVAPLYADWPVTLELRDASGEVVYDAALPLVLSDLCDGEEFTVKASVPFDQRYWDGFTIGVGITDPLTGDYAVRLSSDTPYLPDGLNVLYEEPAR